jgi:hypothetical protein
VISVDSATGIPLAVRIDARGSTTPAVDVQFTKVSFDKPAASTFAFTPPPGATVEETTDPASLLPLGGFRGHGHGNRNEAPDKGEAPTVLTPPSAPTPSSGPVKTPSGTQVTTVGTAWESVAIISGLNVGRQFQTLFANSPTVAVGSHSAQLVSTSLLNALVLDDGRIAVAAMTPDAIAAAVAGQ